MNYFVYQDNISQKIFCLICDFHSPLCYLLQASTSAKLSSGTFTKVCVLELVFILQSSWKGKLLFMYLSVVVAASREGHMDYCLSLLIVEYNIFTMDYKTGQKPPIDKKCILIQISHKTSLKIWKTS